MREQRNQGLGKLLPDGTCHIHDLVGDFRPECEEFQKSKWTQKVESAAGV